MILIPVVVLAQEKKDYWRSAVIISSFLGFWIFLAWTPHIFSADDIIRNYYTCIAFLLFYIIWTGAANWQLVLELSGWLKARKEMS